MFKRTIVLIIIISLFLNSVVYANEFVLVNNELGMKLAHLLVAAGLTFTSYPALVSATNSFIKFVSVHAVELYNRIKDMVATGSTELAMDNVVFDAVEQFVQQEQIGQVDIEGIDYIPSDYVFSDEYINFSEFDYYVDRGSWKIFKNTISLEPNTVGMISVLVKFSAIGSGTYNLTLVRSFQGPSLYRKDYILDKTALEASKIYTYVFNWYVRRIGDVYYASFDGVDWINVGDRIDARTEVLTEYRDVYLDIQMSLTDVVEVPMSISIGDVIVDVNNPKTYWQEKEVLIIPPVIDLQKLVNVSYQDLDTIDWDTDTGDIGQIGGILQGISSAIQSIYNLLTEGLIGDIGSITFPQLGFSITEKFPFSLPWDVARIFNVLNAPPKSPDFTANIGGVYENAKLDIKISSVFSEDIMQKVRFLELIGFCLLLIISTPNLLGGAK